MWKLWNGRVTMGGQRQNTGWGGYPAVNLSRAREMAVANLLAIKQGKDLLAERHHATEGIKRLPPLLLLTLPGR